MLYPHAKVILQWKFADLDKATYKDRNSTFDIACDRSLLLHDLSTYSRQLGDFRESEQQGLQALSQRQGMLPPGSNEILESMPCVALTIAILGRREEALELQRKVLEGSDALLGPMHRKTLEALNQLGNSLRVMGFYAKAEVQHRRELSSKRILLDEDPQNVCLIHDLTVALDNVATCLRDQGEYQEAQALLQEAFERGEAILGDQHPSTWQTMDSLATVHGLLGNEGKAHSLFTQLIAWKRNMYGDEHPFTLFTRGEYMLLLEQEGHYSEVEEVAKALLKVDLMVYGSEVHFTLHHHGVILERQKKYTESTAVFQRLLALQLERPETEVGRGPRVSASTSRHNIKVCLEAEEKMNEAKDYASVSSSSSESKGDLEDAEDLRRKGQDAFDRGHFADAEALARQEL